MSQFTESEERRELRKAVASLGAKYGEKYFHEAAAEGRKTTELWAEAGRLGYLGVSIPEEFGGGGGDIGDLAAVCEELATAGCPLLLMVVSPAIVGTTIAQYGTQEQKERWLPGLADGTATYAFSITEPDAGSNSHNIVTHAEKAEDGSWVLNGTKTYISGAELDEHVEQFRTRRLEESGPFTFVAADALVGQEDAGLEQLFAGLNPERIMAASMATGTARWAIRKAVAYAKEREVWGKPIGAHQAISHPLARLHIDVEMARLLTQKAAALYAAGDLMGAGEAANMAKVAAGEAAAKAVDQAIQTHGGNGLALEYGLVQAVASSRLSNIAPVSKEMALNFVAQFSLGLPKSY